MLITLLVLFVYHVTSDRVTPYTSQSNIEVLLVQIAPQVTGQVIEVATHDNERVKKGQLLYRIDPEPFEIALRVAEANLAVVQQNLSVSGSQVRSAQSALTKQRTELEVSKELGGIIFDLTKEKALSETDSIRARSEIERATADVAKAEADLESAKQKLGPPGDANPQVAAGPRGARPGATRLHQHDRDRAGGRHDHQPAPVARASTPIADSP